MLANFNASSESAFVINTTPSTGVQTTIHFRDLNDGIYNVSIFANDTSGRSFVTSNFTITVDNTASDITGITNATIDNSCDRLNISWTTNESTNFTIDYGIDTNITTRYSNASKGTSNSFILNFGINGETKYYFNISSYDTGNNLNKSTQLLCNIRCLYQPVRNTKSVRCKFSLFLESIQAKLGILHGRHKH